MSESLPAYLRRYREQLGENHESQIESTISTRHEFVLDGTSFISFLWSASALPWVYGGEYAAFARIVSGVLEGLMSCGIRTHLVFDGPTRSVDIQRSIKHTVDTQIGPSVLFHRTSQVARSSARFLNESSILPPLCYEACIAALDTLSYDCARYHAEGDTKRFCVELASKLNGFVAGSNSELVFYTTTGYQGYIPLDSLSWILPTKHDEILDQNDPDPAQFMVVNRGKKHKPVARGISPPPSDCIGISFFAYQPSRLAKKLSLPPTALSLLGAFLGNQLSNALPVNLYRQHFQKHHNDVIYVASVIEAALSSKARQKPLSGFILIRNVIDTLMWRPELLSSSDHDTMTSVIVDCTLQYVIEQPLGGPAQSLWPTKLCPLHPIDSCPLSLLKLIPGTSSESSLDSHHSLYSKAILSYIDAYWKGNLSPNIINLFDCGTFWPIIFLENPDQESCQVTVGRGIRLEIYKILGHFFQSQLPLLPEVGMSAPVDDLLKSSENSIYESPTQVTEYIRKGSSLSACPIILPEDVLHPELPVICQGDNDRLNYFLSAMGSCTPLVMSLPKECLMVVACMRWVVQTAVWSCPEAQLALYACLPGSETFGSKPILNNEKAIQHTAEILAAFENANYLRQVLLLPERILHCAQHFSGMQLHSLFGWESFDVARLHLHANWSLCWHALSEGLDSYLAMVPERKQKQKLVKNTKSSPAVKIPLKPSLFTMLGDLEEDG
ncbi:hypothetical protein SISSUDRAFT_1120092 [Sistotremastrum suecicum HHB10207 ss-3]|uniref:Asteroid domain-containing protein n=1 Tax=Sistotremastrum suecicum HHB10207 ss-3 TaxID=1314776 RepID=A0A166CQZ0_9AGAM|nr:hypothetical protein SISSUDRAFT_1120092 [Sistotremastrum suecicum HHB10207 ss-3]